MKFDILAESIIRNLNEGRLSKSEKYSGIDFDAEQFKDLVDSKALDSAIETQILSQKGLAGLSKEKLDEILNKIADEFSEFPPQTFDEFKEQLTSVIDEFFVDRGPRRAVYVARLAKSIGNVILDKNTGVVTSVERTSSKPHKDERNTDKEQAIINHIYSSDEPTNKEDLVNFVAHTFAKEEDEAEKIVNELIGGGVLAIDADGIITSAENDVDSSEEDVNADSEDSLESQERERLKQAALDDLEYSTGEDEEEFSKSKKKYETTEGEEALNADRDIEDIFRRTIGNDRDYESSNY